MCLYTEADWRIYLQVKHTIIGLYDFLLPVWQQAIIWSNDKF